MRASLFCLLSLLAFAGPAQAWEIKTTGEGLPIRWADGEVVIDLSMGAESFAISQELGDKEVGAAFAAWQSAANAHVSFRYKATGDKALPTKRDGRNVVRWGTEADDPHVDPQALATTYVTYQTSTGEILEADIVVNAVNYEWSAGDCHERYDLQNILAHESGHFVGLDHSEERDSTMFASAGRCETNKRELSADDQEAASYLYENLRLESPGADPIVGCTSGGGSGLFGALLILAALWRSRSRQEPASWHEHGVDLTSVKRALARAKAPRRVHRTMRWLVVLILAMVVPSSAYASSAKPLAPDALKASADLVVQARVVSQEVRLVEGWPVTVSRLEVSRCDREHCPATVEVEQLGGEIGELGLLVSGVRHLALGGDFVLFLEERNRVYRPVAKAQGIFAITAIGSKVVLRRNIEGLHRERPSTPKHTCVGPALKIAGKACQATVSGDFETLSWNQFEEIFGSKLLK